MNETMGQLIALLFLSRDVAHRAHLKARGIGSEAAHEALGDFYPEIEESGDEIAELFQGEYEVLLDIPFLEDDTETTDTIYEGVRLALKRHKQWIVQNRYKACPEDQTSIQNVIDEALAKYQKLNYKLFELK